VIGQRIEEQIRNAVADQMLVKLPSFCKDQTVGRYALLVSGAAKIRLRAALSRNSQSTLSPTAASRRI
jgi:hypothetical protein